MALFGKIFLQKNSIVGFELMFELFRLNVVGGILLGVVLFCTGFAIHRTKKVL